MRNHRLDLSKVKNRKRPVRASVQVGQGPMYKTVANCIKRRQESACVPNVSLRSPRAGDAADPVPYDSVYSGYAHKQITTYVSIQDTGGRVNWSHPERASLTKRKLFLVLVFQGQLRWEKTSMNKKWKCKSFSALLLVIVAVAGLGAFFAPK